MTPDAVYYQDTGQLHVTQSSPTLQTLGDANTRPNPHTSNQPPDHHKHPHVQAPTTSTQPQHHQPQQKPYLGYQHQEPENRDAKSSSTARPSDGIHDVRRHSSVTPPPGLSTTGQPQDRPRLLFRDTLAMSVPERASALDALLKTLGHGPLGASALLRALHVCDEAVVPASALKQLDALDASDQNAISVSTSSRARRYAVTRLSRALDLFFQNQQRRADRAAADAADAAFATTTATDSEQTSHSNSQSTSSATGLNPPITGGPVVAHDVRRFLRECGADAAVGREITEQLETLIALGEIFVCAALHSDKRGVFVQAVMALSHDHQDTLADAVHRVVHADEALEEGQQELLKENQREHDSHSNLSADSAFDESPSMTETAHAVSSNPLAEVDVTNVLKENASVTNMQNGNPGLGHRDTFKPSKSAKIVSQETQELRERVMALENELRLKNALIKQASDDVEAAEAASFRTPRQDKHSSSKQALSSQPDTPSPSKPDELQTPSLRGLGTPATLFDTATSVTMNAEHVEELRQKAELADELQIKLKRATVRLDGAENTADRISVLEAENENYRNLETSLRENIHMLETQQDATKERMDTVTRVNEGLQRDLTNCKTELADSEARVVRFGDELREANNQIASILGGSSPAKPPRQASTPTQPCTPEAAQSHAVARDSGTTMTPERTKPEVRVERVFSPEGATEELEKLLGIVMSWDDIVECVRGVVDAMREMDEADAAEAARLEAEEATLQAAAAGPTQNVGSAASGPSASASMTAKGRDNPSDHEMRRRSTGASSTSSGGAHSSRSSLRRSRIPILQDFLDVDMRMEAAGSPSDDDFDFAADQAKVKELEVDEQEESTPGVSPKDIAPTLPRRRSSVPSLPTVPEDYEGFVEHGIDRTDSEHDSQAGDDGSVDMETEEGAEDTAPYTRDCLDLDNNGDTQDGEYGTTEMSPPMAEPSGGSVRATRPSPHKGSPITSDGTSAPSAPSRSATHATSPAFADGDEQEHSSSSTRGVQRAPESALSLANTSPDAIESHSGSNELRAAVAHANHGGLKSLDVLAQQISDSREEARLAQAVANSKTRECLELRKELALLIKEVDGLVEQRDSLSEHEREVVAEKERLIEHLRDTLTSRTKELEASRQEAKSLREKLSAQTGRIESMRQEALDLGQKLRESAREYEVKSRAHEVEIARLTAQLESSEIVAQKLGETVSQADAAREAADKARHSYYEELIATVRGEKEAAERARAETRKAAEMQAEKLSEIHRSAKAAAEAREYNVDMRLCKSRRSTKMGAFLRRIVAKDNASTYDTSLTLRPVEGSAYATAQLQRTMSAGPGSRPNVLSSQV